MYLCQVSDSISCGACCGLYNVADPSFENLSALLERRTDLYDRTPRDFDSLAYFAEQVCAFENQRRPYPEFHHCPYLGLVGENRTRTGCLLHPLGKGNKGVDHRGLSHWGGLACAGYFCPTCHELPARYKTILRACAENWYIFGLAVTENEALATYFGLIESLLGQALDADKALANEDFKTAVCRFLSMKVSWPHRELPYNRLGNYFFKDNLYPRRRIDYQGLGLSIPNCDPILRSLDSCCATQNDAEQAIRAIDTMICRAADALRQTL